MAKKKEQETTAPNNAVKEKPGGRQIGSWFADAASQGGTDAEIAERINAMAQDANKDYQATVEKVADWRAKQSGGKPPARARSNPQPTLFERRTPTLDDLMKVKEAANGIDAKTVAQVATLAKDVGGLDNLMACLSALERLME